MTQFGCRVSFDDSEMQTLQRALCHYLEICRREIKKSRDVPFTAHRGIIKRFRAKLGEQLKLTPSFTLDEAEMDVVQRALKGYLDACEREIANGATVPFIADEVVIPKILATLEDEFYRAIISTSLMWAARKQT
jgi:hypothetical protein